MRTIPVPIPDPSEPMPDPTNRPTWTVRRLEHVRWSLEDLSPGALALAQAALDNALDARDSALAAAADVVTTGANTSIALAAANFKGTWATRTGAAAVPYSVSHLGGFWMLLSNLANVTTKVPGVDPEWQRIDRLPPFTLVTTATQLAASGMCYALANTTTQGAATNLYTGSRRVWDAAYWTVGAGLAGFFTVTQSTDVVDPEGASVAVGKFVATGANGLFLRKAYSHLTATQYAAALWVYVPTQAGVTSWNMNSDWQDAETSSTLTSTQFDCWVRFSGTALLAGARATLDYNIGKNGAGAVVSTGFTFYATWAQCETGSVSTSDIYTLASAATRLAGEVAPQRVYLPPAPVANDWTQIKVCNGSTNNVVDPCGKPIENVTGPMRLDDVAGAVNLQYINNSWRLV